MKLSPAAFFSRVFLMIVTSLTLGLSAKAESPDCDAALERAMNVRYDIKKAVGREPTVKEWHHALEARGILSLCPDLANRLKDLLAQFDKAAKKKPFSGRPDGGIERRRRHRASPQKQGGIERLFPDDAKDGAPVVPGLREEINSTARANTFAAASLGLYSAAIVTAANSSMAMSSEMISKGIEDFQRNSGVGEFIGFDLFETMRGSGELKPVAVTLLMGEDAPFAISGPCSAAMDVYLKSLESEVHSRNDMIAQSYELVRSMNRNRAEARAGEFMNLVLEEIRQIENREMSLRPVGCPVPELRSVRLDVKSDAITRLGGVERIVR